MLTEEDLNPEIWRKIQEIFADALGFDEDEIELQAKVVEDLEAESIDLLDILHRLNKAFDINIPQGGIGKIATGDGANSKVSAELQEIDVQGSLNVDGSLTTEALDRLSEAMPEVPKEEFVPGLKETDIHKLFRVETFYHLVVKLQEDG